MARTKVRSQEGTRQRQVAAPSLVPFVAASHEHEEPMFEETVEITTNEQQIGPFNVPAYGYQRDLWLQVETVTEGEDEAEATESEDLPFNILSRVEFADVNGAPLFNPMSGYSLLWANILGGYRGVPDPRQMPYFSAKLEKPKFSLLVPTEISRKDAFGSIANQNTGAMYKLYLSINSQANLGTKFKKFPKLVIKGYLEAWSQPDEYNLAGRPQAEAPPLLDSAQYHSHYVRDTSAGNNTVLLTEVGDLIRFVAVICRDAEGKRSDAVFADPVELKWDGRVMHNMTRMMQEAHIASSVPQLKTRDTGVFAFLFNLGSHGTVGDDSPTLWYPTVQSTRLEIAGTTEAAGTWDIITNTVAPVAVAPAERYEVPSRTGLHPEIVGAGQVGGKGV